MIADPVLRKQWYVLANSSELAEGSTIGRRLLGEDIVLWRSDGIAYAWQDLCIHRGTKLSLGFVDSGCLVCPYHYWTYNTSGQCVKIPAHPTQVPPAKAKTVVYHCQERYGRIWVAPEKPKKDIPRFAEWEDPSFQKIFCGPYVFDAFPERAMENALDVAHLSTLHEGYLGDRFHAEVNDYKVEITRLGIVANNVRIWQPNPDGTGIPKDVIYTYRVYRPLIGYMEKRHAQKFSLFFTVTPVDDRKSLMWMWMNMNYAFDQTTEKLLAFQDAVAGQDIPIVNSQRPELLPLDLQRELHLRSDRIAIKYRDWLSTLGVTYGVS